MRRMRSIAPALWLGIVVGALAGEGYGLTCKRRSCDFSDTIIFEGTHSRNMVTGYCGTCKKLVHVEWARGKRPPVPIISVWMPVSGKKKIVQKCPHCARPFLVIETIDELKDCPKCHEKSLEKRGPKNVD